MRTNGRFAAVPLQGRFWLKVDTSAGPKWCWPWTGAINPKGYGYISDRGRDRRVHRVAYELGSGKPIPPDLLVCHSCDNRKCCNPAHLFLGTAADNSDDMVRKGRHVAAGAKLKPSDIPVIQDLGRRGLLQREIAEQFGVHRVVIGRVLSGKAYKRHSDKLVGF